MLKRTITATVVALAIGCTTYAQPMQNLLSPAERSLSAIAALEAKGDILRLSEAIDEGYDSSLTTSQIKEALTQLYAYTGFPRSLNGLTALQKVISQRTAEGKPVPEGVEASPLPSDYNALEQGTAVQTRLVGAPYTNTFAPAADYYLKAHLFGDIFSRDNLSAPERELVTVSAISALPGCESQLVAHVSGARNMGLSDELIHSIPLNLEEKVGLEPAYRCLRAISTVYGEPFDEVEMARRYRIGIENSPYPVGEPNSIAGQYFIGRSYLAQMDTSEGGPINVTFEPGCRNNWHIHHASVQVLICVAGRGWLQFEGQDPIEMTPGVVVAIPAETKHWHGAARDSWFQHLTYVTKAEEGASNEWLERVEDEEYFKLK